MHGTYNSAEKNSPASCTCNAGWIGDNCETGNAFIACDGMTADCENHSRPLANLSNFFVFHLILIRFVSGVDIGLKTI